MARMEIVFGSLAKTSLVTAVRTSIMVFDGHLRRVMTMNWMLDSHL